MYVSDVCVWCMYLYVSDVCIWCMYLMYVSDVCMYVCMHACMYVWIWCIWCNWCIWCISLMCPSDYLSIMYLIQLMCLLLLFHEPEQNVNSFVIKNIKNQFSWRDAGRSRGPTLQICSFLAAALQWQRSCWHSIPHHGCYFLFLDPFCLLKSSPQCFCR